MPTAASTGSAIVVAVVRAYFDAWFDGDRRRMDGVLHPGLAKRSLGQVDPASPELRSVTKEQMLDWTAEGEGKAEDPGGDRRIEIELVDLYGNIATVVVRSPVYREYLHLAKTDDGWTIVNALWHLT